MNVSPLNVCKAEDRPKGTILRDVFPRSRTAVGICDLLLPGIFLVGAGTPAVSCSFKVKVVTENP